VSSGRAFTSDRLSASDDLCAACEGNVILVIVAVLGTGAFAAFALASF